MKSFVDIEFVKANSALAAHEIEGLDALYPDLFDTVSESVSSRFAGRAVQPGQAEVARKHIAALVARELFSKLGTQAPDKAFAIDEAAKSAEEWLAMAPSISEARKSAAPPPTALADAADPFPRSSGTLPPGKTE